MHPAAGTYPLHCTLPVNPARPPLLCRLTPRSRLRRRSGCCGRHGGWCVSGTSPGSPTASGAAHAAVVGALAAACTARSWFQHAARPAMPSVDGSRGRPAPGFLGTRGVHPHCPTPPPPTHHHTVPRSGPLVGGTHASRRSFPPLRATALWPPSASGTRTCICPPTLSRCASPRAHGRL